MKEVTNEKGMTLVEVLLGLTVLGIMAVLIGGVFVESLRLTSRAGDLDRTGYTAAKVTENAINGQVLVQEDYDGDGNPDIILDKDVEADWEVVLNTALQSDEPQETITISFPDTGKSIDIMGDQKKITSKGNGNDVTIEVFIPDGIE